MNRRHFIKTSAAELAASTLSEDALSAVIDGPPKRVGLIGHRMVWQSRSVPSDSSRARGGGLSMRDVDKQLLKEAADMVSILARSQASGQELAPIIAKCLRIKISTLC